MSTIKFDISYPTQKFDNHLKVPNNERIIFSAPFGSGKTYFLKEYFNRNDLYEVIHLYPVNYSVASNEDVFELVKYDILFELLGKDVQFDTLKIEHIVSMLDFGKKNGHHILAPFLTVIPELGKSMFTIYKELKKLNEEYLDHHKNAQVDEEKQVIDYLEGFTKEKGSIYEEDFYTQLINQLVSQLNTVMIDNNEGPMKKQSVLILDDLDRIDPDHIFRILNVLSAHLDHNEQGNKFGFDKVIVVFDQHNVHRIFKNKYGSDVDYSGYIDKFYSHKIFSFKNGNGLEKRVFEVLNLVSLSGRHGYVKLADANNVFTQNVAYVIMGLVRSGGLTVRRLRKLTMNNFHREHYKPNLGLEHKYYNDRLEIIYLFEFLFLLFGSWGEIIDVLNKCTDFEPESIYEVEIERFIGIALVVLDVDNHRFKYTTNENKLEYIHQPSKQTISYATMRWGEDQRGFLCDTWEVHSFEQGLLEGNEIQYFPILLETAKRLNELDAIQMN